MSEGRDEVTSGRTSGGGDRHTPRILSAATVATLPDDLRQSLRTFLASRREQR